MDLAAQIGEHDAARLWTGRGSRGGELVAGTAVSPVSPVGGPGRGRQSSSLMTAAAWLPLLPIRRRVLPVLDARGTRLSRNRARRAGTGCFASTLGAPGRVSTRRLCAIALPVTASRA